MLSSLYSGISGLLAGSEAISVIGNNIANVNTVAYKSQSALFEDMLSQTVASSSGTTQIGRGVTLSTVKTDFSSTSFQTTNSSTDLAIGGDGFFIVKGSNSEALYYTRAGSFSLNSDGYLVNSGGYTLQGKAIDQATGTAYGVDTNVVISSEPSKPQATSKVGMALNLESDSAWAGTVGAITGTGSVSSVKATDNCWPAAGTYTMTTAGTTVTVTDGTTTWTETGVTAGETITDFGTGSGLSLTMASTLANGTQSVTLTDFDLANANTTSNYNSSITVYDSLGSAHSLTCYFTKASTTTSPSTSSWEWNAVLDASDSATGTATIVGTGTLVFNDSGTLTSGGEEQTISCSFSGGGALNQSIGLVFGSGSGGGTTTSYPIASTTDFQTQDGYAPGTLTSTAVDADGVISGTYSNGQVIPLYQITLANFNNKNGLKSEGGNLYSATEASGVAYTNTAGVGSLGSISSKSLEESNVDLATQFVNMIVAERGYQANGKVITTTDEMLQELMQIKR